MCARARILEQKAALAAADPEPDAGAAAGRRRRGASPPMRDDAFPGEAAQVFPGSERPSRIMRRTIGSKKSSGFVG